MNELPQQFQRTLPQNQDAEKALLGSLMISARLFPEIIEMGLNVSTFHNPVNGLVFSALFDQYNQNHPTDFVTLTEQLHKNGSLDACGGAAYLTDLSGVSTSANALYYATIMLEKWRLRGLIVGCTETASRAYDEQENVDGLISELASTLSQMVAPTMKRRTFKEALHQKLERMMRHDPDDNVLKTGIEKLDLGSPLKLGDMPLICGERKAGKSVFSLTMAVNVSAEKSVLYFSLEDREEKVIDRVFSSHSKIPLVKQHSRDFDEYDMRAATKTVDTLGKNKITIRDDVYDLDKIVAVSKQVKTQTPDLSLIVVDYAQLVRAVTKKNANREQEVALVSRTLRLLSMELNVALILLCQLNADGATRESKALEQDATACWMIKHYEKPENTKRLISIPWQRNGDSGIHFPVCFLGNIARVENLSPKEWQEYADANKK